MNIKQIFTIIVTISLVSSLFLLMLNEEKMYLGSDFKSSDISVFDQTQKIEEAQKNLYNKFGELTSREGKFEAVVSAVGLTVTGLVELGSIMVDSVMLIPKVVEGILNIVLPPEVSSVVTISIFSLISIILIIELIRFIIGKL